MIDQRIQRCQLCGRKATDRHHVFGGANRRHSEEHGLVIWLCRDCHARLHANPEELHELRREVQEFYESLYGHENFMEIFGRNYLDD